MYYTYYTLNAIASINNITLQYCSDVYELFVAWIRNWKQVCKSKLISVGCVAYV